MESMLSPAIEQIRVRTDVGGEHPSNIGGEYEG